MCRGSTPEGEWTVNKAPWVFGNEKSRHKGIAIESKTPLPWKEAYKLAGLNWSVALRDPQSADDDAIPADEWKQVVKIAVDAITQQKVYLTLGMVGLRYTLCQNEH